MICHAATVAGMQISATRILLTRAQKMQKVSTVTTTFCIWWAIVGKLMPLFPEWQGDMWCLNYACAMARCPSC